MFRNQQAWMKAVGIVAILGIVLGNVTPAVLQAHPCDIRLGLMVLPVLEA